MAISFKESSFKESLKRRWKRLGLVFIISTITGAIFGIVFNSVLLAGIISGLTVVITHRFLIGNPYGSV